LKVEEDRWERKRNAEAHRGGDSQRELDWGKGLPRKSGSEKKRAAPGKGLVDGWEFP
jgi:hypothetical protein